MKKNSVSIIILILLFCLTIPILTSLYRKNAISHTFNDMINNAISQSENYIHNFKLKMIPRVFKTKIQEGMENQTKRKKVKIVCLGDSIFQNNNYVGVGDSVEDILNQRLSESDSYALMLAEGNSLIKNVYPQIQNLEDRKDWGGKTDYVFLSVGISDILKTLNLYQKYMIIL